MAVTKEQKAFQKFEKVLNNYPFEKIMDTLVRYDENGGYCLFEKYVTEDTVKGIRVEKLGTYSEHYFSSTRYAVAWAIMDKRNLLLDANKVLSLDRQLADAVASIKLYEKYVKKTKDNESKYIYLDKLINNIAKRKIIYSELEDIVKRADAWQIKQFEQSYYK